MDVFFRFRPTEKRGTVFPLEMIKNQETPGKVLQKRVREGVSRTYYVDRDNREPQEYPTADETGYLMVWIRSYRSLPPGDKVTPDEQWIMNENGRVIRYVWDLDDDAVTGSDVDPVREPLKVERPDVCGACYQVPALNGCCGCT